MLWKPMARPWRRLHIGRLVSFLPHADFSLTIRPGKSPGCGFRDLLNSSTSFFFVCNWQSYLLFYSRHFCAWYSTVDSTAVTVVTLRNTFKIAYDSQCRTHVVEGRGVPGPPLSLGTLIFKMGVMTLVLRSCSKSRPPGEPTINVTLPLLKCSLCTLKRRHDLRGWRTCRINTHVGIL